MHYHQIKNGSPQGRFNDRILESIVSFLCWSFTDPSFFSLKIMVTFWAKSLLKIKKCYRKPFWKCNISSLILSQMRLNVIQWNCSLTDHRAAQPSGSLTAINAGAKWNRSDDCSSPVVITRLVSEHNSLWFLQPLLIKRPPWIMKKKVFWNRSFLLRVRRSWTSVHYETLSLQ